MRGVAGNNRSPAERREHIVHQYAGWTALSALRSGSPIKSREVIYPALGSVEWAPVFDTSRGPISSVEFDRWHRQQTEALGQRLGPKVPIGWVVKLINVYLKTSAYIGGLGRPGLRAVIHPPIDGGLWKGLERQFRLGSPVCRDTHCVTQIKAITTYDIYLRIIKGCRAAAETTGRDLIEVEEWWAGGPSVG